MEARFDTCCSQRKLEQNRWFDSLERRLARDRYRYEVIIVSVETITAESLVVSRADLDIKIDVWREF